MPDNAPVIYPSLSYRDARAAIDWLEKAFGFQKLAVYDGPDGSIAHAEMNLGPAIIMLATAQPQMGWISPLDLPAVNQSLYIAIDDPDSHYQRARSAGAEIVREPNDTEYGSREYGAKDPEGHIWSFGTYRPTA